jgi:hypothetical protein
MASEENRASASVLNEKVSRRGALSGIVGGQLIESGFLSEFVSQTLPAGYTPVWYRSLGGTPTQPVMRDGVVYVADSDGNLFGYDLRSGDQTFRESVEGSVSKYGLAISGSTLVAAVDSAELAAFDLDAQNGKDKYSLGGDPAGITAVGNRVYTFDTSGDVLEFDTERDSISKLYNVSNKHIHVPQTLLATQNSLLLKAGVHILVLDTNTGELKEDIEGTTIWEGDFGKWTGTMKTGSQKVCVLETFRSGKAHLVNLQEGGSRLITVGGNVNATCGPTSGLFVAGGSNRLIGINEFISGDEDRVAWDIAFESTGLSMDVFGEQLVVAGRSDGRAMLRSYAIDNPRKINWTLYFDETQNLIKNGAQKYEFTKPVRVGQYYGVTGSGDGHNWIASFGPESRTDIPTTVPPDTTRSPDTPGTLSDRSETAGPSTPRTPTLFSNIWDPLRVLLALILVYLGWRKLNVMKENNDE